MTQREVFETLRTEMFMKISWREMYPHSKMTVDKIQREATRYAVKHTWHWFNNQEEFKKNCFYAVIK